MNSMSGEVLVPTDGTSSLYESYNSIVLSAIIWLPVGLRIQRSTESVNLPASSAKSMRSVRTDNARAQRSITHLYVMERCTVVGVISAVLMGVIRTSRVRRLLLTFVDPASLASRSCARTAAKTLSLKRLRSLEIYRLTKSLRWHAPRRLAALHAVFEFGAVLAAEVAE